jgi:hypothetical protein
MPNSEPDPSVALKAVETYLGLAFEGTPPVVVQSQVRMMRSAGTNLYRSAVVTRNLSTPPTRYSLRLGNRYYPHMKLSIELAPDDLNWLFRVDTHDRHVCPPEGTPEHDSFVSLMQKNQTLAESIEARWAEQGLPTFKTYLRDDLARRAAAQSQ